MKRDMELCRKILLKIEEQYVDSSIEFLTIEGYSHEQVAYQCRIMHEAGWLSHYRGRCADDHLVVFYVGSLTWEGHEFLDKIRDDSVWGKTKNIINKEGLPFVLDVVKNIASSIVAAMTEGAINALKK